MKQLTAALALLPALMVCTAAPGDGADYLFVGSSSGELWRAETDGAGLVQLHDRSDIRGVVADLGNGHLYHLLDFFNQHPDRIVRTLLDGSEPTVIASGLDDPRDIELDDVAGKLYWTERGAGRVARSNIDGSSVEDVLTGLDSPWGLGLDLEAAQLYVTSGTGAAASIVRAGLDGSNPGTFISYTCAYDVEVDTANDKLYVGSCGSAPGLSWVGLDGSGLATLVSQPVTGSIKVRDSSLYYAKDGNLIRRDLDGSNPVSLLPASSVGTSSPFDLDLGSGHVFAIDLLNSFLYRFDIDPVVTNPLFIAGRVGSLIHDVAVDPATGTLYLLGANSAVLATDRDAAFFDLVVSDPDIAGDSRGIAIDPASGRLVWGSSTNDRLLQAVNADGSGLVELATGLDSPHDVAVDPATGRVYFTDGADSGSGPTGMIRWVPIGGGVPTDVLTGLSQGVRGIALDLEAGKVYWTDHVEDTISRANLDGSDVELVLSGLTNPHDVAVDGAGGRLYWTEGISGSASTTGAVRSAALDGSDPQDVLTGLSSLIRDLTLVSLPDGLVFRDGFEYGTGRWSSVVGGP